MAIQSRRRKTKSGRGRVLVWLVLIGVVGVAGGAFFYRQEMGDLVRLGFSWQKEAATEREKYGRGTIYDRGFKELAVSLDRVSVFVRPRELEDLHTSAERLAPVLGMNEQELLERFDKDGKQTWLAKDISLEEEIAVKELRLPGIFLHREQVRFYPHKQVAAHVIGFADRDMGLAGVELYYNRLLDQASIAQADFPNIDLRGHHRTGGGGQHLVLTIDLKIQDFLERYVATLAAVHEGAQLAALLMETETGAIVAHAGFPFFDPNLYYQYNKEALTSILLEPISIPPSIQRFFRDATLLWTIDEGGQPPGPWSLVATVVDPERQRLFWIESGLAVLPELDYCVRSQGDVAGIQPIPAALFSNGVDPAWQATPMQILLGVNFFVNGGHKVIPHVLDRVLERRGEREYFFRISDGAKRSTPGAAPASLETWRLFRAQARAGVLGGAFLDAPGLSFQAVDDRGGEYRRDRMLLAVLPGEKPELIMMVVMRQPCLEPSTATAKGEPALAGSAEKILPSMVALQQVYKNLADMLGRSEKKEDNYRQQEEKKTQERLETMHKDQSPLMPELTGLSLRRALCLLQDKNIRVRIEGTGRVVAQSPAPGASLRNVQECRLTLKRDEKPEPKAPARGKSVRENKVQGASRPETKK